MRSIKTTKVLIVLLFGLILSFLQACEKDPNPVNTCRLIESSYYEEGTLSKKYNFEYEGNLMIRYYVLSPAKGIDLLDTTTKYSFYYSGDEVIQVGSHKENEEWLSYIKHVKTYNNDKLIERIRYTDYDHYSEWTPDFKYTFSYNGELLAKELYYDYTDTWELTYQTTYNYENNQLTEAIYSLFNSGVAVPYFKSELQYSGEDLSQQIDYNYIDNTWEPSAKYLFEYQDNSIANHAYTYESGQWISTGETSTTTLNDYGVVASVINTDSDNYIYSTENYIYEPGEGNYRKLFSYSPLTDNYSPTKSSHSEDPFVDFREMKYTGNGQH